MDLINQQTTKKRICDILFSMLDKRRLASEQAIRRAEESKLEETKSSAGDKFETGRAMMQSEQEMNEMQLAITRQLISTLSQINLDVVHDKVEPGSLASTNQGVYFISIGIGNVCGDSELIFCISPDSPIGQLLIRKTKGDSVIFQNKQIDILEVL